MIRWTPWRTAWFVATGVPGLALLPRALSVETASVGLALGLATFLLGHTVGLHRCTLHRALRLPGWLRDLLLVAFVCTGLGGPLAWMRVHNQRDRWQNEAHPPVWFRYDHGRLRDLWWNLHTTFVEDRAYLGPGDRGDPSLRLLQRTWLGWNLLVFALLWAVGGWEHLVVGGLCRVWLSLVLHWWVGYEAHASGAQPYPVRGAAESGRNRPVLGILSLGEGFHNNHHAFPDCARIGRGPWQLDAGWAAVVWLERLGLATDVKRPGDTRVRLRARARGQ
jgi:stearoyl-CoA desaturase (delta-9 desaturase)